MGKRRWSVRRGRGADAFIDLSTRSSTSPDRFEDLRDTAEASDTDFSAYLAAASADGTRRNDREFYVELSTALLAAELRDETASRNPSFSARNAAAS